MIDAVRAQWELDLDRAKKELPKIGGWRYTKIKQYANAACDRGMRRPAELFIVNCWRHLKYQNYHSCDEIILKFYRYVLEGQM